MMFRYLSPIALILWATCSTAAIQNSDFWFHDDGDIVFIDGKRGAPLHIDYIGAPLTKPLTVRVTPNNPKLKIAAPTCTFTKKDDDCRLTVQNAKEGDNVYGVNQFTLTEVGGSRGVLNAQAASDTNTVGFGVGVQGKDMPKPIVVVVSIGYPEDTIGRAVAINATQEKRNYAVIIDCFKCDAKDQMAFGFESSLPAFSLPPQGLCYPDIDLFPRKIINPYAYKIEINTNTSNSEAKIQDITNPSDPIYNAFLKNNDTHNISSCSAEGNRSCASNKWGSMIVGLANPGSTDMEGGVRAGKIEILRDNSWNNHDAYIYYSGYWNSDGLALLQIQGSTDGSENWDVKAATPSILDIKSAPPCSNYLKGDPSVTYKVIADVYGPGSVTMSGGKQCVIVKVPNSEFTRCTGSGIKDTIYEITAVPEAGKTFKGWNSKGLCDDAKTTCRFPLNSEVSIQPLFW
jgi:hypothetical protein